MKPRDRPLMNDGDIYALRRQRFDVVRAAPKRSFWRGVVNGTVLLVVVGIGLWMAFI